MDKEYWNSRYVENNTGWDINQVSPPLQNYIDKIDNKNCKILIPGCGNAYEAKYLLENGFNNVSVLDISSVLVSQLKEKFKGKSIKIIEGDFFEHDEKYDLILEQTFFCAITPEMREMYVKKAYQLLKNAGCIAGLLFNTQFEKPGPPFGGNREEYIQLFNPFFTINELETCKDSINPRQGNELFFEFCKKRI
ncbi:MAG: methyltransferase domain-containing protein [Daejeonella sp.]